MGLSTGSTTNGQYLRVKAGKFFLASEGENAQAHDKVSGIITEIFDKEEVFNGKPVDKTYFGISSTEGKYLFNVAKETTNWSGLISFLKNVDLTREVSIHAMANPLDDGKIATKLLVSQDGTYMKSFFKKDTPTELPSWKKVKVGKLEVWDKSEWSDKLESALTELKSSVGTFSGVMQEAPADTKPTQAPTGFEPTSSQGGEQDDLPF